MYQDLELYIIRVATIDLEESSFSTPGKKIRFNFF